MLNPNRCSCLQIYGVAQLMAYLGTKTQLLPGSPYTLCDYAAKQFGIVGGWFPLPFPLRHFQMDLPWRRRAAWT